MNQYLEVREFDCITGNPDYEQDPRYKYLPDTKKTPAFTELVSFIHDFTGDEQNADALEVMRVGYRRNVGDVVTMSNYVGIIQLKSGYQIQVLPKISFLKGNDEEQQDQTKRILMKMLVSMRDFPSKVLSTANLLSEHMNLYEIFISMYVEAVRDLVKHGIKSAYIPKESNERFFKGKLLVSENIRNNACHGERFFVRFDEFQADRPENKLVKSTLLKLQKLTGNVGNARQISQLLSSFELVEPSTNIAADFEKCHIDRTTREYDRILKWSKVFLTNKSFTSFSGNTSARSLLFPMEKVFESYVAQKVSKIFRPEGFDVSLQDSGYYLFDEPKQFKLRPDIVITAANGQKTILDTKWKRLIDNPRVNFGISQGDMYQMYAYSKKYSTATYAPEVWLLYPVNEKMRDQNRIQFTSNDGVIVHLFFVDLANVDNSIGLLLSKIKTQTSNISE